MIPHCANNKWVALDYWYLQIHDGIVTSNQLSGPEILPVCNNTVI
jgi:hypothetical protein